MTSRAQYLALLSCNHTAFFQPPPTKGDEVWCSRCHAYRIVTLATGEWSIKCKGCRLGRKYGSDEKRARLIASRHSDKFNHPVRLVHGETTVETVQPHREMVPGYLQWLANNPQHQQSLRNLRNIVIKP